MYLPLKAFQADEMVLFFYINCFSGKKHLTLDFKNINSSEAVPLSDESIVMSDI